MKTKDNLFTLIVFILLIGLTSIVVASSFRNFTDQLGKVNERLDVIENSSSLIVDRKEIVDSNIYASDSLPIDRIERLEKSISHLYKAISMIVEEQVSQSNIDNADLVEKKIKSKKLTRAEHKEESRLQRKFLGETFQAESVDDSWAPNAATKFDNIQSNSALELAQISNVDCRQTMCKADIFQPKMSLTKAVDFDNNLMMELTKQFRGGLSVKRELQPDGTVKMQVYAVREGHKIPIRSSEASIK